jgi:SAM-dependent methyltransferase
MSLAYRWKVRCLRGGPTFKVMRRAVNIRRRHRGQPVTAADYIRLYAPGKSFVDVGGMWGIDGEHTFEAARAGATKAVCVDLYRTPAFDRKVEDFGGQVEFVLGDASSMATVEAAGSFDVVWCFGVLYHHPSPFEILLVLRQMCRERLVLETWGIPEIPGLANMALYVPHLDRRQRARWEVPSGQAAAVRCGITTDFDPAKGYTNNFWAPTPSCMRSMLAAAGFRVEEATTWFAPSRHVYSCTPVPGAVTPKG